MNENKYKHGSDLTRKQNTGVKEHLSETRLLCVIWVDTCVYNHTSVSTKDIKTNNVTGAQPKTFYHINRGCQ